MYNNAKVIRSIQERSRQSTGMQEDRTDNRREDKKQHEDADEEPPHVILASNAKHTAPEELQEQEHEMGSTNGNTSSVSSRKESKNKKCFHSQSLSVRLLPTHTMTSTCIHPPDPFTNMIPARNKNKKADYHTSQKKNTQSEDNGYDPSTTKCDSSSGSITSGDPLLLVGLTSSSKGKDERRERNRFLARKRRERKTKWNDNKRTQIDHITADNQELRNKNKALVKELISLGVDARTVMSRITPQAPTSPAFEFPNQIINNNNARSMSNNSGGSLPQQQYQPQQMLSIQQGMANGNAFQHMAGNGPPPPQLSSPAFFHSAALPLQSQQMIRPLIHLPHSQPNPWQQQTIPLLTGTGHNVQAMPTAEANSTAAASIATNNSSVNHHPLRQQQYTTGPNALSSLAGAAGFTGRGETAEDFLSSYRQALMVSPEIISPPAEALYESAFSAKNSLQCTRHILVDTLPR
jgi:hypothetical protein